MIPAKTNTALSQRIDLNEILSHVDEIRSHVEAPNTKRAYAFDWQDYQAYCDELNAPSMPPDEGVLISYFGWMSSEGKRYSTIERRRCGLLSVFRDHGYEDAFESLNMRKLFKGLRKMKTVVKEQKEALTLDEVKQVIGAIEGDDLKSIRDRALVLVGFAGGFRVSELIAIEVRDVKYDPEGMRIRVRRSKSDQEGKGFTKGIVHGKNAETCPVRAVRAWLEAANISEGPVWRGWMPEGTLTLALEYLRTDALSPDAARKSLKKLLWQAGLNANLYSMHSLRIGLVTEAVRQGKSNHKIRGTTAHSSDKMVNHYRNEADAYERGVGDIGL